MNAPSPIPLTAPPVSNVSPAALSFYTKALESHCGHMLEMAFAGRVALQILHARGALDNESAADTCAILAEHVRTLARLTINSARNKGAATAGLYLDRGDKLAAVAARLSDLGRQWRSPCPIR